MIIDREDTPSDVICKGAWHVHVTKQAYGDMCHDVVGGDGPMVAGNESGQRASEVLRANWRIAIRRHSKLIKRDFEGQ